MFLKYCMESDVIKNQIKSNSSGTTVATLTIVRMNNYEVMFIVDPSTGEENVNATVEKFKGIIEEKATVNSFDIWGNRRLAYLINDKDEGYYVLAQISAEPDFPADAGAIDDMPF